MITINSNKEARALIHNGVLAVDDDIEIAFDGFCIDADIKCKNIYSKDKPRDIAANNLNVRDINADDIIAHNIIAYNLYGWNLNVNNIDAWTIDAKDINYYAVCFAHDDIHCNSIKGRHPKAKHFCIDGEITILDWK